MTAKVTFLKHQQSTKLLPMQGQRPYLGALPVARGDHKQRHARWSSEVKKAVILRPSIQTKIRPHIFVSLKALKQDLSRVYSDGKQQSYFFMRKFYFLHQKIREDALFLMLIDCKVTF